MNKDLMLTANQWHNVYATLAAAGWALAAGTPIVIYNKTNYRVMVQERPDAPDSASWEGAYIDPTWPGIADQVGVSGCWVKCHQALHINVQVST